ncbi:MAG: toxin-antitoxin system YwqK family antitoxin [Bacteroidales bacterium]|jgi:antitoxin component YwqK of YwqJK toxin-antitoxin module|nr:toxin-antitoxin system YwqK family antitoxin [Bacteroidales bacterium]
MKRIRILLILLLPILLFAQGQTNVTDKNGKKQGPWKKYADGKLLYEGQFKDDVPVGTFKYYHTNGKLKSETEFVQGVHKVRTVMYHENGHKASEGAYIDQQKDGEWRYYSERDTLIKIENYKLGKRNGQWKTYSTAGVLLEECNYLNDKLDGVFRTYYVNGNPSLEEHYVAGKTNGLSTAYYPNKNISITGNHHNGVRDGEWNTYDVNGKIRSTAVYKNQRLEKTYIYLYQKGVGQKLNQDMVAYFVKNRDKMTVVLKNGNKLIIDESIEEVERWLDLMVFVKVNPRYIIAVDAIVSYTPVAGDDNDAITIKVRPTPDEEIYSEGNDARLLKALLSAALPKE